MLRLLLTLVIPGALIFLAGYFICRGLKQAIVAFSKVEFIYVRFRDGVLVLKRQTRFGGEEIRFATGQAFLTEQAREDSAPELLVASTTEYLQLNWFHYPSGHPVTADSEEEGAIARCLRFADATGLLAAEGDTNL